MPNIFATKTQVWPEASDTVLITRDVANADGSSSTTTTIYNGAADVQYESGALSFNPSGPVDAYDVIVIIDPVNGVLPAFKVNDTIQINGGETATVVLIEPSTAPPIHVELKGKRGGLPYTGKK